MPFSTQETRAWATAIATDWIPARYMMAILGFFGFVFNFMLRVNISVAIVAMVNQSAIAITHHQMSEASRRTSAQCSPAVNLNTTAALRPRHDEEARNEDLGEFAWDEETQALVIGSFFWGYTLTQIPGGRLAEICGAKHIFGFSILLAGICNIFMPFVAAQNPVGVIALRILLGLAQGTTYPSMHAFIARWAPPDERSRFNSIVYSGSEAGTVTAFLLSGLLINWLGWKYVFLVTGGTSIIWTLVWMLLAYDSPEEHPRLSPWERETLCVDLNSKGQMGKNEGIPWGSILTSLPFWAVVGCSVAGAWQHWTFVQLLPTYLKTTLGFDIKKNSILSSAPFIVMWIFELIYGCFVDRLRTARHMSTERLRKLSSFISLMLPAGCIAAVAWVDCNAAAIMGLFTVAIGLSGAKYSAQFANFIDIAPNFAGTLLGIAYCFVSIPGWLSALTAGVLTNEEQTLERWRLVFYTAACVNVVGFLFYALFASGEVQPWNEIKGVREPKENDYLCSGQRVTATTITTPVTGNYI